MNYWWTSDYHFSHKNIITYCNRPFNSVEEMNETIIRKHNERVNPEDTVFFLGDFVFKCGPEGYRLFEQRLNGKFIFIRGNHDRSNSLKTIIAKIYIHHDKKDICLTHRPENADPDVSLNICGHVHEHYKVKRLAEKSLIINVGVDVWDYFPVSFDDIRSAVAEFLRKGGMEF